MRLFENLGFLELSIGLAAEKSIGSMIWVRQNAGLYLRIGALWKFVDIEWRVLFFNIFAIDVIFEGGL